MSVIMSQITGKSTGCATAYLSVLQQKKVRITGQLWGGSVGNRFIPPKKGQ